MTQLYPEIKIERIKNPSRFYAIPLLGFVVKLFMVIPIGVELWFLKMAQFSMSVVNACNIFFRGRYWKMAYSLNLGIMQLEANVSYFLWGLTDIYPGFTLSTTNYELDIPFNKTPSKLFATPLLGMLFRLVLLIPYLFYRHVLSFAASLAIFVSWILVLFKGRYPETTYEIARDSVRVDMAVAAYFLGMSDAYPSWWMSMNHKPLKILLLTLAALFTLLSFGNHWSSNQQKRPMIRNYHNNTVQNTPNNYTY